MANVKILILRDVIHDRIHAGDIPVDADGNLIFVVGKTEYLNLPEYNNTTPAEGDIWRWNNKLWTYTGGTTREILLSPEPMSSMSSMSLVSESSLSSSVSTASSSSSIVLSSSSSSSSV